MLCGNFLTQENKNYGLSHNISQGSTNFKKLRIQTRVLTKDSTLSPTDLITPLLQDSKQ